MSPPNLKAVDQVVKILRELDRYNGAFGVGRRSDALAVTIARNTYRKTLETLIPRPGPLSPHPDRRAKPGDQDEVHVMAARPGS